MAASIQTVKSLSDCFMKLSPFLLRCRHQNMPFRRFQRKQLQFIFFQRHRAFSLLPFATVFAAASSDSDGQDKPFEPNDARLRSSECLKNAAGLVVDSTSAVLSQTVYAIINIEKQYVELLDALVQLLEYQAEVLDHQAEEQRIADIILEARHEINQVKKRREDLALLFSTVEKLADSTAEVAFATGSDYASTCAGERLHSAQQEVKKVFAKSEIVERLVAETEAKVISIITKHEENQAKQQEAMDSDDFDDGVRDKSEANQSNVEEEVGNDTAGSKS